MGIYADSKFISKIIEDIVNLDESSKAEFLEEFINDGIHVFTKQVIETPSGSALESLELFLIELGNSLEQLIYEYIQEEGEEDIETANERNGVPKESFLQIYY